jgi:hypothetical protein
VMLAGFLVGTWFRKPVDVQTKYLRYAGIGLIIVFVVVRFINLYGDPAPWSTQERGSLFTFLSFINVSKYPPSLLFLCLTIGIGLLALSFLSKVRVTAIPAFFKTFGSVPFFYYVLHFFVISAGCFFWTWIVYGKPFNLPFTPTNNLPAAYEPSLLRIYVVWVILIALLYFPCRWFSTYRRENRQWWLSYL